jgi:hypothetical protein
VAEIVAAYAELTAGEAYLGTGRRLDRPAPLADLVGYRPRPRVAAQGWVRVEVDKGADPLLPAGTRVQSPGTAARAAQTFEVAADAQLRSEWNQLTADWVPGGAEGGGPVGPLPRRPGLRRRRPRRLRAREAEGGECVLPEWVGLDGGRPTPGRVRALRPVPLGDPPDAEPLAVANVVSLTSELGTTVVEFDRELGGDGLLDSASEPYAAYRVLDSAGEAAPPDEGRHDQRQHRLDAGVTSAYGSVVAVTPTSIILDADLGELSVGQTVAIVAWKEDVCDVVPVKAHAPVAWAVAPGTTTRASKLEFEESLATLSLGTGNLTVYVVDSRVVARHYEFPSTPQGATQNQLRLFPAPSVDPARVAVETLVDGKPTWEVLACEPASAQESASPASPRGLIVDLVDGRAAGLARAGAREREPRSDPPRLDEAAAPRQRRRDAGAPALRAAGCPGRVRRRRARAASCRPRSSAWTESRGTRCRASTAQEGERVQRSSSRRTAASSCSSATATRARGCRRAGATSRAPIGSAAAPKERWRAARSPACSAASAA